MDQQQPTPPVNTPEQQPASSGTMKWLLIVLGIVIVAAVIYWFVTR